jgi:hypothetical protein
MFPELQEADLEAQCFLANLGHVADVTQRAGELWEVRGTTQWTAHLRLAMVDWSVGAATQGEWVVLIILQLVGVCGALVTCLHTRNIQIYST